MQPLTPRLEALRRSFWLDSAIGLALALILGLLLPAVQGWADVDVPLLDFRTESTAATVLQTIATVSMSVAGISFSVVVVALQLASQQLSPRVLRTFQADRTPQVTLALFVATFVYCLVVLARMPAAGHEPPELAVAVALGLTTVTFGFFIAFIHDVVNVLQASDLIRRIAVDAQRTVLRRYPDDLGTEPDDPAAAERVVEAAMDRREPREVRSPRAGYVVAVDPDVIQRLSDCDALLKQKVMIGDFVLTGQIIARLWSDGGGDDDLLERFSREFDLSYERNVVQDIAFPVRQLADVALRGLSPSLNDPTTAENAMNSIADILARFAERGDGVPIRLDDAGDPRFIARAPTLNDLTHLAFEQVRVKAAPYPVFSVRLTEILEELQRAARDAGTDCREAARQAELLAAGVAGEVPTRTDADRVREAADHAS